MKASEEFAVGKNDIAWVGSTFKENLYDLTLTKGDTKGIEMRKLTRWMNDTEITAEMNPEPLTLGDVLAFLKTADRSLWYLFRVVDANGELWAVDADWGADGGGWYVGARSVAGPLGWCADGQVVSRRFYDSKPLPLEPSDTLSLDRALEIVKSAGYEVSEPSLAKKFQAFREKHGKGSGDAYWDGLVVIAYEYFNKPK